MARSGFRTTALAAGLVLWALAGCKVNVASVDLSALADVPADVAVDPGTDGPATDLPRTDVPAIDLPVDDAPAIDAPVDDVPPAEPCGTAQNPNCSAAACDDGDPSTVDDACVMDPAGAGCICRGTADPCGFGLNPQCVNRQCTLAGGAFGLCQAGATAEVCTCTKINVCGLLKPVTTCTPLQCWLKPGVLGACQGDALALTCGCKTAADPCGTAENPQCWSNVCDLGLKGQGRCRPVAGGGCGCVAASEDLCSDAVNPQCTPDKCELLGGARGQCMLGPLGLCWCGPAGVG